MTNYAGNEIIYRSRTNRPKGGVAVNDFREGVDRWRANTPPPKPHPVRRPAMVIGLCLTVLLVMGVLLFWYIIVPAVGV